MSNPLREMYDCYEQTGSYADCWYERFVEFYVGSEDVKDPANRIANTWIVGSVINALLVEYLLEKPEKRLEVRDDIKSLREILNSTSFKIYDEFNLNEKYQSIKNLLFEIPDYDLKLWWTTNRGFYLMMGFSNVREYLSWASMMLMWAFSLTGDITLRNKAENYLNDFLDPPSKYPPELLTTPETTNEDVLEEFSEAVFDVIYSDWNTNIRPYLYGSKLTNVRAFAEAEFTMTKDTIRMAGRNRGYKKEEGGALIKFLFAAFAGYLAYNVIRG